jgi:hypothetical protein
VLLVQLHDGQVAPPEPQTGVPLPRLGEPVDPPQLDGTEGVHQVAEHARAIHRSELERVTDERQTP